MLDMACFNAVVSRKMALSDNIVSTLDRDFHRTFMIELVNELLAGKWLDALTEDQIPYGHCGVDRSTLPFSSPAPSKRSTRSTPPVRDDSPQQLACKTVLSKQLFAGQNKKRRWWVVCKWEGRPPIVVTDYYIMHCVCLCQMVHPSPSSPHKCNEITRTCWEKFYRYYLPRDLSIDKEKLRPSSALYKLRLKSTDNHTFRNVARTINL